MADPTPVEVRIESAVLPTYEPAWPDPNPMFLEARVYQGSSGRVYPLPFTDRIAETPTDRAWQTIVVENEYLRATILPALGGRIHRLEDKTNGYDLIYHQTVIKPALVGLAGPWISGGIEFNWPQHHRPSTFLPADFSVERHPDGSATVWLSEHDPMARMKGMHGVRLRPGSSSLELAVRLYNRTSDVQTFLWWANTAVRVHDRYQSFFPPDVTHVADHAKRATSSFPIAESRYYGVDYGARSGSNDLSWYANIPVPTSYMALGSTQDFMGGYDHRAGAGLVHVADHHISPGKKQWTWGNHAFGFAWDRNLTDPTPEGGYRPYIELMAGVYTDNQPDFSFLQPGETKTWSQYFYPIQQLGPVQTANARAAVHLDLGNGTACIGIAVNQIETDALAVLEHRGAVVSRWQQTLAPGHALKFKVEAPADAKLEELTLRVLTHDGREIISYAPRPRAQSPSPAAAQEPPPPAAVGSCDELHVIGLHLEQYRHATRSPEDYWREALRRDPGDARAHLALGRRRLRSGEFAAAEIHLRASIDRLVSRNPNPADGEPHYQLGLCLRHRAFAGALESELLDAAYAALYKATWNGAWSSAAHLALAEIDALRGRWPEALGHLNRTLRADTDHLRARDLKVIALRKLGRASEAEAMLAETLALDPLDWWARHLAGQPLDCDDQVKLDLAFDCARCGLWPDALAILAEAPAPAAPVSRAGPQPVRLANASLGAIPMLAYTRAWLCRRIGDQASARRHQKAAANAVSGHCFPSRLDEAAVLESAIAAEPRDARAPFYLGHLLYDRRRYDDAIHCWEVAVHLEPSNATAWRNLGIAYFNVRREPRRARAAYEQAFRARPTDARICYERDQLWKRLGVSPQRRRRELLRHAALVAQRDDLTVELCCLHNQLGAPLQASRQLARRRFQPWEGGEGLALGQHVRAQLLLGQAALRRGNAAKAVRHFQAALGAPENLGEASHLLANRSDAHYWLGCALAAANSPDAARRSWTAAAEAAGDFQAMRVRPYSEMTYYSALALQRLERPAEAHRLLRQLLAHALRLAKSPARIDYFATSLPTMLLFNDDLSARQRTTALFLQAQAHHGLSAPAARVRQLLMEVLTGDPNHSLAADWLSELGQWKRRPAASAEGKGGEDAASTVANRPTR